MENKSGEADSITELCERKSCLSDPYVDCYQDFILASQWVDSMCTSFRDTHTKNREESGQIITVKETEGSYVSSNTQEKKLISKRSASCYYLTSLLAQEDGGGALSKRYFFCVHLHSLQISNRESFGFIRSQQTEIKVSIF